MSTLTVTEQWEALQSLTLGRCTLTHYDGKGWCVMVPLANPNFDEFDFGDTPNDAIVMCFSRLAALPEVRMLTTRRARWDAARGEFATIAEGGQ